MKAVLTFPDNYEGTGARLFQQAVRSSAAYHLTANANRSMRNKKTKIIECGSENFTSNIKGFMTCKKHQKKSETGVVSRR